MISLGIRKVVDTSAWDQSFVDGSGQRTSRTGIKASYGSQVSSSGSDGNSVTEEQRWNAEDPESAKQELPSEAKNSPKEEMNTYENTGRKCLTNAPADSLARSVNPFLEIGSSCHQKLSQTGNAFSELPGIGQNQNAASDCRQQRGETVSDPDMRCHDIDLRCRGDHDRRPGGVPMGEVAAWLDGIELFEALFLRFNRSTSSSPPVADHVTFDRSAVGFDSHRSPSVDGRSSVFDAWSDKTTSIAVPLSPSSDQRPSIQEPQAPALDQRRTPIFDQRASVFDQRSPIFDQRAPVLDQREIPVRNEGTSTPASIPPAYSRAVSFLPAWDLERVETVYARLDLCGFYLGRMSMDEARRRLAGYPVGTFLLRDSSDSRFLFSLSVQTIRGTTSIRVLYEAGLFRLDSDPDQTHLMPTFECILLLIRHYVRRGAGRPSISSTPNSYVFRESTGRRDTPVLLRRALETTPGSLAHTCRKQIHRSLGNKPQNISRLHLKPSLKDFLAEYPYDI